MLIRLLNFSVLSIFSCNLQGFLIVKGFLFLLDNCVVDVQLYLSCLTTTSFPAICGTNYFNFCIFVQIVKLLLCLIHASSIGQIDSFSQKTSSNIFSKLCKLLSVPSCNWTASRIWPICLVRFCWSERTTRCSSTLIKMANINLKKSICHIVTDSISSLDVFCFSWIQQNPSVA